MSLRIYATPLTIGSFLAVSVTGICMLLGYRNGLVDPLHEVSSILFLVGSVLHIILNKRPTLAHLKRPLGAMLLAGFAIVSALALIPMGHRGNDPGTLLRQMSEVVLDAHLHDVAALTGQPEPELMSRLAAAGFGTVQPAASLREIADANHKHPFDVLGAVLPSNANAEALDPQ